MRSLSQCWNIKNIYDSTRKDFCLCYIRKNVCCRRNEDIEKPVGFSLWNAISATSYHFVSISVHSGYVLSFDMFELVLDTVSVECDK